MNQTSEVDEERYSSIAPLPPVDDMFRIEDNVIDIGLTIIMMICLELIEDSPLVINIKDVLPTIIEIDWNDWMLMGKGAEELNLHVIIMPC